MKIGVNFWTEPNVERLIALRNEALSCSQIAKRLSSETHIVTRNATIGKLGRLHMPSLYYGKGRPTTTLPKALKPQPLHKPASRAFRLPVAFKSNPKEVQPPKNPEGSSRPVSGKGKTITKLKDAQCRFAVGYNKAGVHLFCSAATDGSSWCSAHHDVVFIKRVAR